MATYFVSQPGLDAGVTPSDANNGTAAGTPWLTLTKVNSFAFVPGDIIQFRRGGIWTGGAVGLNVTHSGTSGSPITYRDYGTGNLPEINGLATLTSWASIGGNLFTATVPNFPAGVNTSVEVVFFDGNFQVVSKMPKGNTGYYNIDSSSGTAPNFTINSTTGGPKAPALPLFSTAPNAVGGEICYRPLHWVFWRGLNTAQTGTSVSFTAFPSTGGGTAYLPTVRSANYGFFLQNFPSLCTQLGEWAYTFNSTTLRTFTMNFTGTTPAAHKIEVATLPILVSLNGSNFITLSNLVLRGANQYLINGNGSHDITITGCNIKGAGLFGIFGNGTNAANWHITSTNTISFCSSGGIKTANSTTNTGWIVSDNTVDSIGIVAGMGGSGESALSTGILVKTGAQVLRNTVTNVGYIPIHWDGLNSLIQDNFIQTYGFVKDDAGSIYCHGTASGGSPAMTGSIVELNICLDGIGQPIGTPDSDMRCHGIYADDGASDFEVRFNTCSRMGRAGFYIHAASLLNIHDNTFYDCNEASLEGFNDENTMANLSVHNNICVARTATEFVWSTSGGGGTVAGPSWFVTTTDTNKYGRPFTSDGAIFRVEGNPMTLAQWRTLLTSPRELNSGGSPVFINNLSLLRFEYNANFPLASKTVNLGAQYVDMLGTTYNGTITLQPFRSAVLIQTGSIAPPVNKRSHGYIIS